jgi:peptidoglycan/xylan/chitin deacetylase (PgdA/CDA1 family)
VRAAPLGAAAGIAAGAWLGWAGLPHLRALAAIRRGPRTVPAVALTFDDGPDPSSTPRIVDLLAAREVAGTFFLVGARAARAPGVARDVAAAGHEVASHGWSHVSLWRCGPRRTEAEVARAREVLADLTGRAPRFFRPPWGMVNAALFGALRRHGQRCVLWSVQPEGLRARSGARQSAHVLRRAHPGAIVDLHDADGVAGAGRRLADALPPMIDGLRDAGYRLVTLADLLDAGRWPAPPPPGVRPGTPR